MNKKIVITDRNVATSNSIYFWEKMSFFPEELSYLRAQLTEQSFMEQLTDLDKDRFEEIIEWFKGLLTGVEEDCECYLEYFKTPIFDDNKKNFQRDIIEIIKGFKTDFDKYKDAFDMVVMITFFLKG